MGSKEHPPSQWQQLSKQEKIFFVTCLFITFILIWTQWQTPANESEPNIELEMNETAQNSCDWRPEPLQGICDVTKSTTDSQLYTNAIDCENACCESSACVSFQYRTKEGCLWGGDTRLGAEKDGVSAWCEPRPPAMWHGEWIKKEGIPVSGACLDDAWNPKQLRGQCFGLGSRKNIDSNTAESCRNACCAEDTCAIWQWRSDAGCFYHKNAHGCQEAKALDFEAFIGKRKVMEGRTYTPEAYSHDFADMKPVE